MADMNIRGIPAEKMKALKVAAAENGLTLKNLVLAAIDLVLDQMKPKKGGR